MASVLGHERYLREEELQFNPCDCQDIRDNRVYTYFNMNENETLTYYIQLNAAYLGKYFLPGTYCSAMYDNSINAGVNGKWVEVVKE
jgi:alpha-2-macroglobulin